MIVALNSGCAYAMGSRRSCDSVVLPTRPEYEQCISNGDGTVACYDARTTPSSYIRPVTNQDIVINNIDFTAQDLWMNDVLRACRQ
jgi:hypothetical protein